MTQVHINNVVVLNNPASILSPIQFQISFQCFKALPGTLDWKIIYIPSPKDSSYDQAIDQFDMVQLQPSSMKFNTDSNPPDFSKIPMDEILGTAAILISVLYEGQQFFRVGYYVINQYQDNSVEPPPQLQLSKIKRKIIAQNPRIMRFEIQWAKHEGNSSQNEEILKKNLQVMGGDPFQQSNGVFQQLQKVNYSFGMFGPGINS